MICNTAMILRRPVLSLEGLLYFISGISIDVVAYSQRTVLEHVAIFGSDENLRSDELCDIPIRCTSNK